MRIDAHQHFWRYDEQELAWLDDSMAPLRRDFSPRDVQVELEQAGFDGAVAVQAAQTMAETRYLLGLAEEHSFIRGVVGWVDLKSPQLRRSLEVLASAKHLKGVRHIAQSEPPGFFADPVFRRGVALLSEFELSYDILIQARQLPEAVELVQALPDVRFVLDHLAKPEIRARRLEPWREQLRRMSALPNALCKLSGLVTEADWRGWRPADVVPYLDVAVACFGTERLLVGSDWPICTLAGSYADVTGLLDDYFSSFSAAERAAVFGGNAAHVYRLDASLGQSG